MQAHICMHAHVHVCLTKLIAGPGQVSNRKQNNFSGTNSLHNSLILPFLHWGSQNWIEHSGVASPVLRGGDGKAHLPPPAGNVPPRAAEVPLAFVVQQHIAA